MNITARKRETDDFEIEVVDLVIDTNNKFTLENGKCELEDQERYHSDSWSHFLLVVI